MYFDFIANSNVDSKLDMITKTYIVLITNIGSCLPVVYTCVNFMSIEVFKRNLYLSLKSIFQNTHLMYVKSV